MSASRRARRVATYPRGTYILAPTETRPFRVITRDPVTGRQIERVAHSEAAARALGAQLDLYREEGLAAETSRTISKLIDKTIEGLVAAGSEASYVYKVAEVLDLHVKPLIGNVRVEDWDASVTEVVLNVTRSRVGAERQRDVWAAMRAMIRRARILRWMPTSLDPMVGLTVPKVKSSNPIDRDSLPLLSQCRLVEDAIEEVMGRRWRIGVELVREAMLRFSELMALRPECIDFVDANGNSLRRVRLTEAVVEVAHEFHEKDLKSHRERASSFHPWLEPHLHELVEVSRPGERMFLKPTGRYMDRRTWSRKWRKALDLAGFEERRWTIHTWRAFGACTWLFDRNADPGAVSEALGHSSVDFTLRRYTAARGSVARTLTDVGDRSPV